MDKKVVLVTGASSGIGHATAKKFIEEGHIVYGVARRIKLMKDLEKMSGKAFHMDVRDDKSVKDGVARVIKEQGRIDILVNNAGYAACGSLEDVTIDEAKAQFETNVFGYVRMIKAVLPHMRKQKSGTIINVTSAAGKVTLPIITWYGASKHALEALSDSLRAEISRFGIKVVIIEPGFIKTEMYEVAWELLDKVKISPPYKNMTAKLKKGSIKVRKEAPGPETIADKIYEAGLSPNPKIRCALPAEARNYILIKRLLGDGIFDAILRRKIEEEVGEI